MSYVQELLAKAEADFNKRRAGIIHHAASIEALGELLSNAGAHGVKWYAVYPEDDRNSIQIGADHDDQRLIDLLQEQGATVERSVERGKYTHHTLRAPGVAADVLILVARAGANAFGLIDA